MRRPQRCFGRFRTLRGTSSVLVAGEGTSTGAGIGTGEVRARVRAYVHPHPFAVAVQIHRLLQDSKMQLLVVELEGLLRLLYVVRTYVRTYVRTSVRM